MAVGERLTAVCCVMLVTWLTVGSATDPPTVDEPVFDTPNTIYSFTIYLTCGSDVTTTPPLMTTPSSGTDVTTPLPTVTTSSETETTTSEVTTTSLTTTPAAGNTDLSTDITGGTGTSQTPTITTTQVPGCIYPVSSDVRDWLTTKYEWTTGFIAVTVNSLSQTFAIADPIQINYTLTYDLQKLSAGGAFDTSGSNKSLIVQLYYVSDAIVVDTSPVSGNWTIEPDSTNSSLNTGMVAVTHQINTVCSSLGSVCTNTNNTCYVSTNGSITCVDKCALFMSTEDECDGDWVDNVVYLKGHCVYDDFNNAKCDCGKSQGDVLSNFYDGYRCVSAAFIVGMAAGGAGFIFVILLTIIFILVVCRSASRDKDHYTAASNGSHRSSNHGSQYHIGDVPRSDATYNNQAYKPDVPKSDSYGDFTPTLTHIDPKADYSIRRPAVVLRPTDNYTNVRHSAYDSNIG